MTDLESAATAKAEQPFEHLLFERGDDGIATITINRPKALNALDATVLASLEAAIAAVEGDGDLRCLIITGAGKAFVAGADIAFMSTLGPQGALRFADTGHRVLARLEALPIPTIAAVNGFCLGGGCELSLACDLVYASERAKFGQPEVKLGLIPGFGGTQRLARRIGPMHANELVLRGHMIRADDALRLGLCLAVFPADALLGEVRARAAEIAARGPVAVRAAKRVSALGLEAPLATANAYEMSAFANLFDSADAKEGMTAFLEKRGPQFQNR